MSVIIGSEVNVFGEDIGSEGNVGNVFGEDIGSGKIIMYFLKYYKYIFIFLHE